MLPLSAIVMRAVKGNCSCRNEQSRRTLGARSRSSSLTGTTMSTCGDGISRSATERPGSATMSSGFMPLSFGCRNRITLNAVSVPPMRINSLTDVMRRIGVLVFSLRFFSVVFALPMRSLPPFSFAGTSSLASSVPPAAPAGCYGQISRCLEGARNSLTRARRAQHPQVTNQAAVRARRTRGAYIVRERCGMSEHGEAVRRPARASLLAAKQETVDDHRSASWPAGWPCWP